MPDFTKQLEEYVPKQAAPIISMWINDTKCRFKVSKKRLSKLGDYRAPFNGSPHQISVNHDLNPYSFLITTVHEFAHLQTWNQYKHQVKPHGNEWKENFRKLMFPFVELAILPEEINYALLQYLNNPAASSCTDLNLYRVLKKYDCELSQERKTLESLPLNAIFALENGRVFQKKEKLRKRYRCIEVSSGRTYLVHPVAEIIEVSNQ